MAVANDELKARYLRDKVMTATPAQRVVMLYDRLGLDLNLAESTQDAGARGEYLSHAMSIVIELRASLDLAVGGPADNLASLYAYMISRIIEIRGGASDKLPAVREIVTELRSAWAQAAELTSTAATSPAPSGASAWVG